MLRDTLVDADLLGDSSDESELIARARVGDPDAFADLFRRHFTPVRRYVLRRTGNAELSRDIASETFLRAFRRLDSFKHGHLDRWLTTIARNLIIDHYKSAAARYESVHALEHDVIVCASTESLVVERCRNRALAMLLRDALTELSEVQRSCIELRFLEEKSVADTAKDLHCSVDAVRAVQYRALRALRQHLLGPLELARGEWR